MLLLMVSPYLRLFLLSSLFGTVVFDRYFSTSNLSLACYVLHVYFEF